MNHKVNRLGIPESHSNLIATLQEFCSHKKVLVSSLSCKARKT